MDYKIIASPMFVVALFAATLLPPAWAAGAAISPAPAAANKPDPLAQARVLIEQRQWAQALVDLQSKPDAASADWNNLMGYVLRKSSPPDLPAAERHYDAALRINPKHLGALEYSGELYLMLGQLPRAQARAQALEGECAKGCEELNYLRAAIAAYQAKVGAAPATKP